jgi:hypothetical protein
MHTIRRLTGMLGLTLCGFSSLAYATSFTIEFTNGHEVVASRVWEEGHELKFDIYQGTAGVPRTLVKRIRTSAPVSHDSVAARAIRLSPGDPDSSRTDTRAAQSAPHAAEHGRAAGEHPPNRDPTPADHLPSHTEDVSADRAKKSRLMSQLDDAMKQYREAFAAEHLDAKQAAWDDVKAYRKQLIELADAVSQKNAGVVPPWWNE